MLGAPGVKAADARSLAMEVKSFRFSENRSSADCIAAALPVLLDAAPRPAPFSAAGFLAGMKSTLEAWQPLLESFADGPGEGKERG